MPGIGSSVNIYARLRKIMPWEGDTLSTTYSDEKTVLNRNGKRESSYRFTKVFNPKHSNEEVFNDACKPMLFQILKGFNAIFMAYGQTGSGKTFSILGKNKPNVSGVLAISLKWLLNQPNVRKVELSAVESFGHHVQKVTLYDLALPNNSIENWDKKIGSTTLTTKNATKIPLTIEIVDETVKKLHGASHFAPTGKNPESSRGHISYITTVHMIVDDHNNIINGNELVSHWIVVDLAGSEGESALTPEYIAKVEQSEIMARRLEAWCINYGLSQLQLIFGELKSQKKTSSHGIGLKRILNGYINNKSYISVLFTISPSLDNAKSTESTLRFAESASLIKCVPVKMKKKVNKDELIQQLKKYLQNQQNIIDEQNDRISKLESQVHSQNLSREERELSDSIVDYDNKHNAKNNDNDNNDDLNKDEENEEDNNVDEVETPLQNTNAKKNNDENIGLLSINKNPNDCVLAIKNFHTTKQHSKRNSVCGIQFGHQKLKQNDKKLRRNSVSSTLHIRSQTKKSTIDMLEKLDEFENFLRESDDDTNNNKNNHDIWKVKKDDKASDEDQKQMIIKMDKEMSNHRRQSRADASFVSSVLSFTTQYKNNSKTPIINENREYMDKNIMNHVKKEHPIELDGFDVNFTLNQESESEYDDHDKKLTHLVDLHALAENNHQIINDNNNDSNNGNNEKEININNGNNSNNDNDNSNNESNIVKEENNNIENEGEIETSEFIEINDFNLNDVILNDQEQLLSKLTSKDLILLCKKCLIRCNEITNDKNSMQNVIDKKNLALKSYEKEFEMIKMGKEKILKQSRKKKKNWER